ncbi:hypothetical protein B0H67DRAFT_594741 [Lasiosphaeris hirsuta]|uniref:Uncharacterized protein n=1 Tax=Lasiosphaeris hirsuta TaxID=260670 RepID=A0AA39ZYB5_9PEZI|nr:hypothetical protein B0H67DRAFT_594741 [Lasiosphaeris hirsuta]
MNRYIFLAYILAATSAAVTTFGPSCQVGSGVTTFPACNAYLNSGDACSTVLDRPGKQKCLCNQQYLDAVYGCESELQLCFLSNEADNDLESILLAWTSLCGGTALTFTPTTPAPASFTPYPEFLCEEVKQACLTAELLLNECITYAGDTSTERWSSCTCRSSLLRLDYSCEYIGNATCLGTGATMSSLWGYAECGNFASVIGTGLPAAVPPGPTTSLPTLPQSAPAPGSTTSQGPAPSSSRPSGGNRVISDIPLLLSMAGVLVTFHGL